MPTWTFIKNLSSKILLSFILILTVLLITTSAVLAGPGGLGGDGQEPWPLSTPNVKAFHSSEVIGLWLVSNTGWILRVRPVEHQSQIFMAQLWDNDQQVSLFNGPLRLEQKWIEGVAVMNDGDFCSIYMYRFKKVFRIRLTCSDDVYDFDLKKLR